MTMTKTSCMTKTKTTCMTMTKTSCMTKTKTTCMTMTKMSCMTKTKVLYLGSSGLRLKEHSFAVSALGTRMIVGSGQRGVGDDVADYLGQVAKGCW